MVGDMSIRKLIEVIERNPRATVFFSSSNHTFMQIVDELGDDVETNSSFSNTIVMKNGCVLLLTLSDSLSSIAHNAVIPRGLMSNNMYVDRFEEPFTYYTPLIIGTPHLQEHNMEHVNEDIYVSNDIGHEWE